jgi:hypothetical protein
MPSSEDHVTSLWLTIISFCEGSVGASTHISGVHSIIEIRGDGKFQHSLHKIVWALLEESCNLFRAEESTIHALPIISNEALKGRGDNLELPTNALCGSHSRGSLTYLHPYLTHSQETTLLTALTARIPNVESPKDQNPQGLKSPQITFECFCSITQTFIMYLLLSPPVKTSPLPRPWQGHSP